MTVAVVFIQGALNLISNCLVIFVTWRNTQWAALQLHDGLNVGSSFSRVMLYHGELVLFHNDRITALTRSARVGSIYFLYALRFRLLSQHLLT